MTLTESPIAGRADLPNPAHPLPVAIAVCPRPVPCDLAGHRYASERCPSCFDRLLGTLDTPAPAGEYRPTYEDVVSVGPIAQAEWAGFTIGCEGLSVVGPAHYSPPELAAFLRGHAAGLAAFEDAESDAWVTEQGRQDAAFGDPAIAHAELVEAIGCVEAREGGAR